MNFKQIGIRRKIRRVCTAERVLKTACLFFLTTGIVLGLTRREIIGVSGSRRKVMITAHRGASYEAPENTRVAIALAIAEGADYVEIDVRRTADGVPVLLHDRALFRTTGIANDIDNVTYAELVSFDAGRGFAEAFTGETVPNLRAILEDYGRKIKFNIELKDGEDEGLAEVVVALVEAYGLEERCVISSGSYAQLERVKKANEKIKTGYILSLVYGRIYGYDAADFFSVRSGFVTEHLIEQAHKRGKEVHTWTVNNAGEMKKMKDMGVDNIITDRPAYARSVLEGNVWAENRERIFCTECNIGRKCRMIKGECKN